MFRLIKEPPSGHHKSYKMETPYAIGMRPHFYINGYLAKVYKPIRNIVLICMCIYIYTHTHTYSVELGYNVINRTE
jgi:hypothetical protein